MRGLFLGYIMLFGFTCTYGQISGIYPDQLTSYFYNPSMLNPAFIPEKGNSEIILLSKLRSGIYSDISTFGATLQKTIKTVNSQQHSIRLSLFNEREGPYISTPRFYGQYAINININENTTLLGGVAMGMVNPKYDTPSRTINTLMIDGAAGIILRHQKTAFGISANQLFNNSSTDTRSINLNRYYAVHIDHSLPVNLEIEINGSLLWLYYVDIPSQINGSLSVTYQNTLETGIGYKYQQGGYCFATIIIAEESQHPLGILALFNSTILSTAPVLGASFELGLKYNY